jgi:UDPglucose 6-dehydrogenase/GDP-mannose 6-dehydrogenase
MKISVIGTGYVGLVSGVCLADMGHHVVCVDVDREKIATINRGKAPFHEKGLEEILRKNLGVRFNATTDLRGAVMGTDVTMIAVGTPFDGQSIDLSFIREVSKNIGNVLRDKSSYHLVVVKSTVVPGTTDGVVLPLLEQYSGKKAGPDFGVGMNPEFLTEGEAIGDFMSPDRIVLGGTDKRSVDLLQDIYAGFMNVATVRTNNKTAEMIKYASNALLATMISFSNEIGNLCAALGGVDVVDVLRGVHLSQYISLKLPDGETVAPSIKGFLGAGCGFGGSCLPKDVKALIVHGENAGAPMPLLNAVISINSSQYRKVLDLLKKHIPSLRSKRIAVLGLSFRPDTSDMRESPAIPVINELLAEGAVVKAYDPVANSEAMRIFGADTKIQFCGSVEEAVRDVDGAILVTRWEEFQRIPELLRGMERPPVFVDGRRMLEKTSFSIYEGIGL